MTILAWPETPAPSFSYQLEDEYSTLISKFKGSNEQAQSLRRFPARSFIVGYDYVALATEWPTIHNFYTARRGQWEQFYFFDFSVLPWTDLKIGDGTGALATFDLPSKSTVDDATLKIYVDGVVETHRALSVGTGGGSSDQIVFTGGFEPALGTLVTGDLYGKIRILARMADKFVTQRAFVNLGNIVAFLIRSTE